MSDPSRPGPKPKRLYVRSVRVGDMERSELPEHAQVRRFEAELERVGRLVARGELTHPAGDLLIFRATSLAEAERVLRTDPFRGLPATAYEVVEWNPVTVGAGANLELAPARGSGRLTALLRVGVAVRDLKSSLQWYQEVLGFRVRERDEATGYVELSLGRGASAVSLIAPRREWGEPFYSEATGRIGTSTGIVFQTDSAAALELRLRSAGARVTEPPRVQPWGGTTLRFMDPDGNEFLAFQVALARGPPVASPTPKPASMRGTARPLRPPREAT
ncbi:MAG: VOC family protein [Thermoplasmata archaeon]|nr:VOC family protein [Thermoplasmata archaeon]